MKNSVWQWGLAFGCALALSACGSSEDPSSLSVQSDLGSSATAESSHGSHGENGASHAGATHAFAAKAVPSVEDTFVENFMLLDQTGKAQELYYYYDAPAIVVMIQGNGCPIVRNVWSDYKEVRDEFAEQGVEFFMLNANLQDSRSEIAEEAAEYAIDVPILKDETQLIAASLEVTRTAEVLVIDPQTWEIRYRGPVNDRIGYERQRPEAQEHYLKDALSAVMAGEDIERPARATKGCIVNMQDAYDTAAHMQLSYVNDVAPILADNCVTCHQEGGIGPWAMTDFETVQGFAPMIREVVRTQRMPPWSADPEIGKFHSARELSNEQRQTLVRWVEAGMPRGEGPDLLAELEISAPEWPLGEPDLIVTAPAFDVPATGIIDYQFPTAPNPINEDRWVRAITVLPGDSTVVHHALVGSSQEITPPGEGDDGDVFDNYLVGFVPGSESYVYPENTGVLVKAGGEYRFQMHYTTSGKATTDVTRIGLYFHDEPPEHILRQQVSLNPRIAIAPNAPDHAEKAYFEFDHPAKIHLLFPHAHYRGKSSKFYLIHPDGQEEVILSVPKYDFNWQHNYALEEPILVEAGTKLVHETIFDNSSRNFANPDPDRVVPWGLQSYDEMLYGSFFFQWAEETADNIVHDDLLFELRQWYGFQDADMDGAFSLEEMPDSMRDAFQNGRLKPADVNGNGKLELIEFYNLQKFQQRFGGSR
ncbi:MAG: redoxin domain-containing protein [Pseudomonadota bacterium]